MLNTSRADTVTFEKSFYCKAPRICWNTLPAHLWNTDRSVAHFKEDLFIYYLYLTKSVYDVDDTSRLLNSLLDRMCCSFLIDVLPNSGFAFPLLFVVVSKVLSFLLVVLLIFFSFFSGPHSGAFSMSDPGLLAKFINK